MPSIRTLTTLTLVAASSVLAVDSVTLFNTWENTDKVCSDDCVTAAQQVCAGALDVPIAIQAGLPGFVDLNATVHNCFVRYSNTNTSANGYTTQQDCLTTFQTLITKTASNSTDSQGIDNCEGRLGGAEGLDATGSPTGLPVYYYATVSSLSAGYGLQSSLDGVPAKGNPLDSSTLFGTDMGLCEAQHSSRNITSLGGGSGTGNSLTSRSYLRDRRSWWPFSSSSAIGKITAVNTVAALGCIATIAAGLAAPEFAIFKVAYAEFCITLGILAVLGIVDGLITSNAIASALPKSSGNGGYVVSTGTASNGALLPRQHNAVVPSFCDARGLDVINKLDACVGSAFDSHCQTLQQ